jgi:hypothetical protein
MKGTPKKGAVDTSAAIKKANALTEATKRDHEDTGPMKAIAVRISEKTYNRLAAIFAAQGTSMAAAGRAAILHLAEQIEAGTLSIPNGVIYRNR